MRPSRWWLAVFLPIVGGFALLFAALSLRAASFRIFEVPSSGMERTVLRGGIDRSGYEVL
jgi:signal peptidase I